MLEAGVGCLGVHARGGGGRGGGGGPRPPPPRLGIAIAALEAARNGWLIAESNGVLKSSQPRRTHRACVPEHADGSPMHSRYEVSQ